MSSRDEGESTGLILSDHSRAFGTIATIIYRVILFLNALDYIVLYLFFFKVKPKKEKRWKLLSCYIHLNKLSAIIDNFFLISIMNFGLLYCYTGIILTVLEKLDFVSWLCCWGMDLSLSFADLPGKRIDYTVSVVGWENFLDLGYYIKVELKDNSLNVPEMRVRREYWCKVVSILADWRQPVSWELVRMLRNTEK